VGPGPAEVPGWHPSCSGQETARRPGGQLQRVKGREQEEEAGSRLSQVELAYFPKNTASTRLMRNTQQVHVGNNEVSAQGYNSNRSVGMWGKLVTNAIPHTYVSSLIIGFSQFEIAFHPSQVRLLQVLAVSAAPKPSYSFNKFLSESKETQN